MPVSVSSGRPTVLIRKVAFEQMGLTRRHLDERLNLTSEEFVVERGLIVIGPLASADDVPNLVDELEQHGLVYFDDFFELSGNWPAWLRLYVSSDGGEDRS